MKGQFQLGLDAQWILPKAAAGAGLRDFVASTVTHGLDHLGLGDHVSFRDGMGFDGLVNSMALLASDPRVMVRVQVYILPLRHPAIVARQLSTIAEHAPGRLVLACGIAGEDPDEYRAVGLDPTTRGARADESLQILRGFLAGETVDFEGRFFQLSGARIEPPPALPIPILIGGRSEAALRRTARFGDGWQALWLSAARLRDAIDQINEFAVDFDRGEVDWQHGITFWTGFDLDGVKGIDRLKQVMEPFYGMPFEKFSRYCPAGTPDEIAEFIAPYIAAGCRSATLVAAGVPAEAAIELSGRVRTLLLGE